MQVCGLIHICYIMSQPCCQKAVAEQKISRTDKTPQDIHLRGKMRGSIGWSWHMACAGAYVMRGVARDMQVCIFGAAHDVQGCMCNAWYGA